MHLDNAIQFFYYALQEGSVNSTYTKFAATGMNVTTLGLSSINYQLPVDIPRMLLNDSFNVIISSALAFSRNYVGSSHTGDLYHIPAQAIITNMVIKIHFMILQHYS